jgi:Galactose oxidase, central domain
MPAGTTRGHRTELRKPNRVGLIAALALGGCCALPAGAAGDIWSAGPNSTYEHVAGIGVELANRDVLVAGGATNGTVDDHGELLDASGGAFSPAGTMSQGRTYDAATLLPNGDVLVAGGDSSTNNGSPASTSAELWSPTGGGTFTSTGSMHVARQVLTLTTLPNGEALAVGGSPVFKTMGPAAGSKTAELYNPATGKWTLTGSMPSGRLGHTATLLPNCKVLIVGDAPTAVTYDYATGTFSSAGSEGSFQRSYQTATLLANGKVLIAGGETAAGTRLSTASVYNPATGKFTPTANAMSAAHSQAFADVLPDGRVLVGGGFDGSTGTTAVNVYDPATNHWSATMPLPPSPFAYSVESATLQNGKVAVIGTQSGQQSQLFTPSATGSAHPPAENCSDLFSIPSVVSAAMGKITVKVAVPFAGGIRGVATVPAQSGVPKSIPYGSASSSAGHSGVFTLTFTPGSSARSLLQSKGSLKVSIAVTFTQPHKTPLHRTSTVTAHWS